MTIVHTSLMRPGSDQPDDLGKRQKPARLEVMEDALTQFLVACGVDTSDPHLLETPARVARAYRDELLSGYQTSLEELFKTFDEPNAPLVILHDIPVYSLCAHHLLPFYGTACVAYKPSDRIVGLSKLARVVDCFARRLQVQERLTRQIVEAIQTYLDPTAVAVLIRTEHMCMSMRGISKPNTQTVTYLVAGEFETDREHGAQILAMLKER